MSRPVTYTKPTDLNPLHDRYRYWQKILSDKHRDNNKEYYFFSAEDTLTKNGVPLWKKLVNKPVATTPETIGVEPCTLPSFLQGEGVYMRESCEVQFPQLYYHLLRAHLGKRTTIPEIFLYLLSGEESCRQQLQLLVRFMNPSMRRVLNTIVSKFEERLRYVLTRLGSERYCRVGGEFMLVDTSASRFVAVCSRFLPELSVTAYDCEGIYFTPELVLSHDSAQGVSRVGTLLSHLLPLTTGAAQCMTRDEIRRLVEAEIRRNKLSLLLEA